jgi:hypothetical protein
MSGKSLYLFIALLLFALFGFSSCTRQTDKTSEENENTANETVSDSNFTETDEDLLTVDYKQFYDELSPHGEWVQVSAEDLGLDLKKSEGESSSLMNDLLGIKNAYADDVNFGMFFVWKPSPDLAVTVTAGEPAVYTPYTNGQWVNTNDGWYFKAPTPYEETTCHYGRWAYSPALGWVWLPGRVWAPAWVEWRENDNYIAWAPVPPSVYIVNNVLTPVHVGYDRYIIVDKRHFMEPSIYKYKYKENKNKIMIEEMTKVDGVMIKKKTVINKGLDPGGIEKVTGKKIETEKINKVKNKNDVKYTANEINVYTPEFTKSKGKGKKESVSKPDKFVPYTDAESMSGKEKKGEEKEIKKEEKGKEKLGKEKGFEKQKVNEKGIDKQKGNKKLGDDRDMKKGNKKFQQEHGNKQDKGSRNEKQNQSKQKGNNKGKGKH